MGVLVVPKAQQLAVVSGLVGAVPYSTAKLHLYSNNLVPTPSNVLADFTAAIYSGYAAKTITWSSAFFDKNGIAVSSSGELLYSQAGATPDTVYGAYMTDTTSAVLLASAVIDGGPFNFVVNGDTLPLLVKFDPISGLLSVSPVP